MLLITAHVQPGQFIPQKIKWPLEQTARGKEAGGKPSVGNMTRNSREGRRKKRARIREKLGQDLEENELRWDLNRDPKSFQPM